MPKTIVAIDLETTGLDPRKDAIIEFAAVRFKGARIEAEFSALVNPGRPLSPFITRLTGISDAMLAGQKHWHEVLPGFVDFVGQDIVVGHNVAFDLGFLQAKAALKHNDSIDTLYLASVLLPSAGRYNLNAVAQALGVTHRPSHRALDDCHATMGVYLALMEKMAQLPTELLAEITAAGQEVDWGGGLAFELALRERAREQIGPRRAHGSVLGPLFDKPRANGALRDERPLQRNASPDPLDLDELAALLEHGGPFAHHFPNYEFRSEQVEMLRAVGRAFSEGRHLIVEAGTGTGKSVGYLIPAATWALQNGERVVVSTNTLNLQDQLVRKDVPDLQAALGLNFRAAVLKGRSQYLCPRRLENMRRHGAKSVDEMRVLAKVLVWLHDTRDQLDDAGRPLVELSLSMGERATWLRLSAEDEGCTTDMCQSRMHGVCPFFRARKAAQSAHVVIVNHALLLADIASENRVLPEYRYLVVDEAHHLEAATTSGLSFEVNRFDLERRLKDLGGPNAGLLGQFNANTRTALPPDLFAALDREVGRAQDSATTGLERGRHFFAAVAEFMEEQRGSEPPSDYTQQVRIGQSVRNQSAWENVETDWEELRRSLSALAKTLTHLATELAELHQFEVDEADDLVSALNAASRQVQGVVDNVDGLVKKPDTAMVYWINAPRERERVSLHAAPLHVGPLVQKHLWHAKESVVLTSATLTVAGDFNYMRGRLSADDVEELAVGSPFDYESSTLLFVANDIPEPPMRTEYQRAVDRALIDLCVATHGRALVLFTSYAQMKQSAQNIRTELERAGISLFDQSDGTPRTTLLEAFKTTEAAVLFGTKSFWEGVDVPGEALSALVIVKLPFDVPSDPIIAARSETYDRAFNEYTLPEAVLKFRQGFGRLIRSRSDRGVVAILDRRVLTKAYGRMFLDSLPGCTVRHAPLAQLGREAARWIDG